MSTRSDALSRHFATVTLGLLTVGVLMASGCSPDRFHSQGCTSDSECRDDRVCEQNTCIALSELDRTSGEDEEDAGADAAPDTAPDAETNNGASTITEEERAIQAFVGTWRTEANGTMRDVNGNNSEPPIPSTLLIEITHTEGMGLSVEIDHSLICPLEASVREGPLFVLTTEECRAGDEVMSLLYSNIAGRGTVQDNGDLYFTFNSQATFGSSSSAAYDLQLTFEGPRID